MLKLSRSNYPKTLSQLPPIPPHIFFAGTEPAEWLDKPRLAVVGSRKPTAYGSEATRRIVSELASSGVVIISGLALGIDGLAHRSALDAGGQTVAVLPSSLDNIYPKSHSAMAEEIIAKHGCLLTEYRPGSVIYKHSFIARNRLIAAFSQGVLITEAALGSGSLHTAAFALDAGLPVMALPGSIFSSMSEGTNQLIKSGAQLVNSSDDVLMTLGYSTESHDKKTLTNLNRQQKQAFDLISGGIVSQDALAANLKIDPAQLASTLTMLEINGLIRPYGAGQWVAI